MAPAILGTSAVQVNVLVNTFFVSGIDGGVSWLSYAFRLMQFPIGIFGVAVGTASIPVLSRMASEGKITEFRNTLSSSMNLVFLMTLPSAFGLVVLSEPIIRLIYERGEFDSSDTTMTAWALAGYSIGLTGYAAIKVLSPAFYALGDAKTPMLIALFSIVVNAIASFAFRNWLSNVGVSPEVPSGLGHVGVALATSSVALVNFLALVFFMRRRISRINGREILSSFARILVASVLMSLAAYGVYFWISSRIGIAGFVPKLIDALLPIAVGGAVFFITAKLLGIRELEQVYNSFARRFRSN
jgi:putative peptidoglycan lipid II flippase